MRSSLGRVACLTALSILLHASLAAAAEPPEPFESKAAQAFMIDAETGTVLYARDPDAPFAPASLAKLMTMEVVFNALKAGKLSLDQLFPVSENAWRSGGAPSGTSTMFAALKSSISVRDLIQGVIVQGANDGCIVLAEGVAGSEAKFAVLMNARAKAIGLARSTFVNATGLPADGQAVTARDMTALAMHIWRTYPDFYPIYAQPEFTWNKILQRNRNPLLRLDIGADGMGTGFTDGSGFAIVGAASRGGKRLFMTLAAMKSDKERAEESRRIMDWANTAFRTTEMFGEGEQVGEAKVFGGVAPTVALASKGAVSILVPLESVEKITARIVYLGPVEAPVASGTPIGALRVLIGDTIVQETPLYAAEDVATGTLRQRAIGAVEELLVGWMR